MKPYWSDESIALYHGDWRDHLREITAHCFWSPRCAHRVTGTPQYVHDAMEVHYRTAHRGDLDQIRGACR